MSFSSTIQVLKVEKETRKSKSTGKDYEHFAARCITLTDDGEVDNVGVITSRGCTPEVREKVRPGTFRAVFALRVSDFGEQQGQIVAMLTDLMPVPVKVQGQKPAVPPSV